MKYSICVSGSAANNCGPGAFKKAYIIGQEIARQGAILLTGATVGIPEWSARGAKSQGGMSIGMSPASSTREHVRKYHLPVDNMDVIVYTGFDYSGRNLLLTKSADAVIEICGRIGTLNEFSIAFESGKPVGILTGTGGAVELIDEILVAAKRGQKNIYFDSDPKRLVKTLLKEVKRRDKDLRKEEKKNRKRKTTEPN